MDEREALVGSKADVRITALTVSLY